MEGFHAGIIVWISLTAKGMQDFFPGQAVFKCLARILASKVAVQNDPFCIPDVQARILYRFHCQFRCHRCAIGIADDFTAAQIHDRCQISPSFFLHTDCYASAAMSALEQLGLLKAAGEDGHIIITCVDGGPDGLEGIRSKYIDATASQQVSYMPTAALDYIASYFEGKVTATEGTIEALAPQLVTLDNVDDPSLWANQ